MSNTVKLNDMVVITNKYVARNTPIPANTDIPCSHPNIPKSIINDTVGISIIIAVGVGNGPKLQQHFTLNIKSFKNCLIIFLFSFYILFVVYH